MTKPPVKSSDLAQDIRNGMNDNELMQKYGLSSTQLTRVLTQLVGINRITREELDTRDSVKGEAMIDIDWWIEVFDYVFNIIVCAAIFIFMYMLTIARWQ